MKALVLTFDKYRPFAEHMIMCYEQLWPNNPFTFRVPYQSEEVKTHFEEKFGNKVEMIKSPSGIVDTMFALSDDLDDNEWVYWCMDDRYPIKIEVEEVEKCRRFAEANNEVDGMMFCNNPKSWLPENVFWTRYVIKTEEGQKYYRRKNYTMIWNHQFLRVKVVRTFFGLFPRVMKQAKEMDYIKDKATLPDEQHLFVLNHNIAIYGESTNRGIMLRNCAESFAKKGLALPEGFEVSNKSIVKGTNGKIDNLKYFFKESLRKLIKRK
jgi:hypothetical protein